MKQITTEAIILKRINFGEADRILTVLTKDQGRVSLLAKGVRKSKSRLAGGLELFTTSDITYIDSRSELKTLISTKLVSYFPHISEDIDRTMLGYEFLKAIYSATHQGSEPMHYEILKQSIAALDELSLESAVLYCWFTAQFLRISGTASNLEKPINSIGFNEQARYEYSYDDMAFFEHSRGTYAPEHVKYMRIAAGANAPQVLARITNGTELAEVLQPLYASLLRMHVA